MNTYMPEHGLDKPESKDDFLKLSKEGTYRFRVMGVLGDEHKFIHGYVAWDSENKPHREDFVQGSKGSEELIAKDRNKEPKYFWAFVVIFINAVDKENNPIFEAKEGKPQVLEIQQITIQQGIARLLNDEDWGNPKEYDITVNRVGLDKGDTKYYVNANPKSPITQEMLTAVEDARIDLRVMFEGGYPFGALVDDQKNIQEIYEQPNEQLARIADNAMNR